MNKSQAQELQFAREIQLHRSLSKHPGVANFLEFFDYFAASGATPGRHICLVGEIASQSLDRYRFDERQIPAVIAQVLQGLSFLHSIGIVHRGKLVIRKLDTGLTPSQI